MKCHPQLALALAMFAWQLCCSASAAVHYVDVNSSTPAPPYLSWATAATTIQEAIDAAGPGGEVVVTNGLYANGGRAILGTMTNRVVMDKPVHLRSVNGPDVTAIQGYQVPGITNGEGAVRCAYLTNGARISGFTLTKGATINSPDWRNVSGGGVFCESTNEVLINCILIGNSASSSGGAVASGFLSNCVLTGNSALVSGAAKGSTLVDCILTGNAAVYYGGAVNGGLLINCHLRSNSAGEEGGAAYFGTLMDCSLIGNYAKRSGGAGYKSTVIRCKVIGNSSEEAGGGLLGGSVENSLIVSNTASGGGGVMGWIYTHGNVEPAIVNHCTIVGNRGLANAGVAYCTVTNSIVVFNQADSPNEYNGSVFADSCATPLPASGTGNLSADPRFVDAANGDFRLQPISPCINAGNNAGISGDTDLDGLPRRVGNQVDMGAYEFQSFRPGLRIATSGTNIILSWPAWAEGFTLEQSGSLPAWSEVLSLPALTNNENTVMVPATGQIKIFRLFRVE